MNALTGIIQAVIIIGIILLSLSVHEFAHAWVANLFGDPTAKLEGRMTINPLKHWDRIGTTLLVVLIFLNSLGFGLPVFGWGKPVPVDERNFTNPRWHGFQTAIAGPMSNFLFAFVLASIARLVNTSSFWYDALALAVSINAFLMFFNLIPIPPLDGSRILRLVLPEETYYALATNIFFSYALILIVIFFLLNPVADAAARVTTLLLTH